MYTTEVLFCIINPANRSPYRRFKILNGVTVCIENNLGSDVLFGKDRARQFLENLIRLHDPISKCHLVEIVKFGMRGNRLYDWGEIG